MHTKGPWTIVTHRLNLFSILGGKDNTAMESGMNVIADILPSGLPNSALHPDEIQANARLIAAAPELLEALELVTNCNARGDFKGKARGYTLYIKKRDYETITEAIRKAKEK